MKSPCPAVRKMLFVASEMVSKSYVASMHASKQEPVTERSNKLKYSLLLSSEFGSGGGTRFVLPSGSRRCHPLLFSPPSHPYPRSRIYHHVRSRIIKRSRFCSVVSLFHAWTSLARGGGPHQPSPIDNEKNHPKKVAIFRHNRLRVRLGHR